MKINIRNLLTVKSIITILITIVFCVLAIKGIISSGNFMTIFTVIIAFYFGTQYQKADHGDNKE